MHAKKLLSVTLQMNGMAEVRRREEAGKKINKTCWEIGVREKKNKHVLIVLRATRLAQAVKCCYQGTPPGI